MLKRIDNIKKIALFNFKKTCTKLVDDRSIFYMDLSSKS